MEPAMSPAGEGEGRGEGAGAGGAVAVGVTLCGRLRQGSWARVRVRVRVRVRRSQSVRLCVVGCARGHVTLCGRLRQGSWAVPRGHLEAFEAVEGVRPMMKWVQPKFLRMIMCWMASRGPAMCIEYGRSAGERG